MRRLDVRLFGRLRIVAGLVLIALALTGTIGAWGWGWIGAVRVAAAAIGFCPACTRLGINTCPAKKA